MSGSYRTLLLAGAAIAVALSPPMPRKHPSGKKGRRLL